MNLKCIFSTSLVLFLVLGGISPLTTMSTTEDISPREDLVILFDEAHGQWFNTSRMQTVLTMVNVTTGGTLYVNKSPFNATNLMGVDVVIITNPGNESTFTVDEAFYLRQYLKRGGRLFLLSNPYSANETLSGRSSVLNQLLTNMDDVDLSLDELKFWTGDDATADTLMDDHHNVNGTNFFLELFQDNFTNTTVISSEPTNISRVLVHTQSVEATITLGEAYYSSYAEDINKEVHLVEELPVWFGGSNQSEVRVVICGSTIMFSDLPLPGTNATTWSSNPDFDNARLFNNTINWLADITPLEPIEISDPITSPIPYFVGFGAILFVIGVLFMFKSSPQKAERPITEAIEEAREARPRSKKRDRPRRPRKKR